MKTSINNFYHQMKKQIALLFAVALASLPFLCGCSRGTKTAGPAAAEPRAVQVVHPFRGEIARTVKLPAFRIRAIQEATLYAKVSGYLKTLKADKGDSVKEGQLLAEIEVPELLADEAEFKAESAVAHTNY